MSGYVYCACRDCFEIAIAGANQDERALCHTCKEAGCDAEGGECNAPHAYCDGGEDAVGACAACGLPFD